MLNVACTNEQKVVGNSAQPKTAGGNAAQIDGALRITVQSGDGTFAQDPAAPLNFDLISGNALGDTVYLIEADADLGAGTELIQELATLTVSGAKAASFGLVAGNVVPKNAAPQ